MHADFRNSMGLFIDRFCQRVIHDLHHVGLALVPAFCDKLFWLAILTVAAFIVLIAVQALWEV